MGTPIQTLPVSAFALKEVDLIGVFRYAATYEYGMSLLASKAKPQKNGEKATGRPLPDLSKLVTHRFRGLDHVKDAFDLATKGNDEDGKMVMKVVIDTGAR
jgi:L-iditol 2-dehydrogenase